MLLNLYSRRSEIFCRGYLLVSYLVPAPTFFAICTASLFKAIATPCPRFGITWKAKNTKLLETTLSFTTMLVDHLEVLLFAIG